MTKAHDWFHEPLLMKRIFLPYVADNKEPE